ncbi:hypothetical protein ACL6C3_17845 [Capilliphycus salinus ALCB114379]|uniref:hypothetical protein n=1 Tax=Capilliphycus salinus TaxID=2768948 RepID=UPI0039A754E3
MQNTSVETRSEAQQSTRSSAPVVHLEKTHLSQNNRKDLGKLKEDLTEEIKKYKEQKNNELTQARRLNRWSTGIALLLTAATAICGSSQKDEIQDLVTPLGTLAVTLNGWITSFPMSKRVSLFERTLVKADNLRSDLEYEAETQEDIEKIRENFKSLKVEFIQENPSDQPKVLSAKSALKN